MIFLDLVIQGIVQGSIYALIALGLTLVYGLLRILHIAHAGVFTLGGYVGVIVANATGSFALAMPAAMLVCGIVGMAIYRFGYEAILNKPPYVALIASIGLLIAMQELFRLVFGPFGLTFVQAPMQQAVQLGGTTLRLADCFTVLVALALIAGLALLAGRTRLGIAWRASVSEPRMAESFGVGIARVRYVNFFIGSALAAVGGVQVAVLNNLVEPTMGGVPSYKALAIIVLGGLGNVPGTLIASLLLGIVEAFGTIYLGDLLDRDAIAFAVLILVLMLRPRGLFRSA